MQFIILIKVETGKQTNTEIEVIKHRLPTPKSSFTIKSQVLISNFLRNIKTLSLFIGKIIRNIYIVFTIVRK